MCVREGKEFEELFPHLGRVCVLKSPFNRGAVTDDDDSILSVLRQTEPGGTRRGKEAEPPLKFGEEGMCRHRPSNLYISSFKQDFYRACETAKKRGRYRGRHPDRDRCLWSQLTSSWHFRDQTEVNSPVRRPPYLIQDTSAPR